MEMYLQMTTFSELKCISVNVDVYLYHCAVANLETGIQNLWVCYVTQRCSHGMQNNCQIVYTALIIIAAIV